MMRNSKILTQIFRKEINMKISENFSNIVGNLYEEIAVKYEKLDRIIQYQKVYYITIKKIKKI